MSSCIDLESVYYRTAQAWFWVPCIESWRSVFVVCESSFEWMTWDDHNKHTNTKRSPWKPERKSFFFWIVPFMVCCLYVWMASTRAVTCTSAVDKRFAMYPSVFIAVLVHLFLIFACLYSHNSVNFVIGFRKFLFCCLGWFSLKSSEVLSKIHHEVCTD